MGKRCATESPKFLWRTRIHAPPKYFCGAPIKGAPQNVNLPISLFLVVYLVPPCLDLVSCLRWSRSSYCNARCCVCWDPINIDTMFIQVVYLSMCSWSCMLSVTSRCFCPVDAFNSKRGYLCSIVGSAFSTPWPVTEGRLVIDVLLLLGIKNWCSVQGHMCWLLYTLYLMQ